MPEDPMPGDPMPEEGDYRHLFDDAMGSSPPSSIDVDAVISGERHRTRLRRTVAATSAAAVVAVIGLIVATLLPGQPASRAAHQAPVRTRPGAPTSTPATTPSTPSPATTATATDPKSIHTPPAGDQAQQLRADLKNSIVKSIPDARPVPPQPCWAHGTAATALTLCGPDGHGDVMTSLAVDIGARAPFYYAAADVPATDGTRGLFVIVQQAGPPRACPVTLPPAQCTTSTDPNGDRVMSITGLRTGQMPPDATMNLVSVRHADGTEVIATSQNWPASAGTISRIDAQDPAAAIAQLREIAVTPALRLSR